MHASLSWTEINMPGFPALIDLSALGSGGFVILGDASLDAAGASVSSAGDVNGDGFDDLIIGAPGGDDGGSYAGEAYVIFGKAGGFATVDLATLAPADGFIIQGDAAGDRAGVSLSSAGDVNGDGYDDIIVGAPGGDDGGTDAGEAYVLFGKAGGFANIDLSNLAAADGFIIVGPDGSHELGDRNGQTGHSVATAGDINGDGFDDLIIGTRYGDLSGLNAGEAYVLFGKAGGFTNIDLAALAPDAGFVIRGDDTFNYAGWSVSSAGDVNGDGLDDVIVGARNSAACVVFGRVGGFTNIDVASLAATDGCTIQGDDGAGFSVSSAGAGPP